MFPPKYGDIGAPGVSFFFFGRQLLFLQHQQASLEGTDSFRNAVLLSCHFQVNSDVVSELIISCIYVFVI